MTYFNKKYPDRDTHFAVNGCFEADGIFEACQCVAKIIFLWLMNIPIHLWPQNIKNRCWMNIFVHLQCKKSINSTNECLKIFMALKFNKYFDKWIYLSINFGIYSNILIFATHWNLRQLKIYKVVGVQSLKLILYTN